MGTLRRPRGRPRARFVFALLLFTLALAGILAYQAQDAARSHRETAEGALRDYAAFAAWQFKQQAGEHFFTAISLELRSAERLAAPPPDAVLPGPAFLLAARQDAAAPECDCPRMDAIRYYFRLDLREGGFLTAGGAPPAALEAEVVAAISGYVASVAEERWCFASFLTTLDDEPRLFAFYRMRDSENTPVALYGFEADPAGAAPLFQKIIERASLLPPSLTRDATNDSLLYIAVLSDGGEQIYRSSLEDPSAFAAHDAFGTLLGGVAIQAAIRPAVAQQLVIGGLPRSRLPLLLGLLALTAGLILVMLLQMRREAELGRLRADFVSGISHELRTPLAQIRMFAETLLLRRTRTEQERHRSLEIIDQEARRLTHLVENVLHFSRAERQATRVEPEPTELAPQLREILESFTPLARARRTELRLEAAEEIVLPVDRGALRQMLLNLLDNALKYGPAGQKVTVAVAMSGDAAEIRVEDEGPGIPPRERERIWEAFRRLARDRESAVGGSGIGLAVVRELAVLHGGHARVEDSPGGGARFVIELPGAARAAGPFEEAAPAGSAAEYSVREAGGVAV